jgi:ketosteroid isomerase-like protein
MSGEAERPSGVETRSNAELFQEAIDAYNRGDIGFVFSRASDDIEVFGDEGLINAGTYRGRDGFERWMNMWLEAWSEFAIEVRDVREFDDRFLLVDVLQKGVGSGSGIPVEMEVVQFIEVRDGLVARLHLYTSREAAEAALARIRADG